MGDDATPKQDGSPDNTERGIFTVLWELANDVGAEQLFVAIFATRAIASVTTPQDAYLVAADMEIAAYHLYPAFGRAGKRSLTPFDVAVALRTLRAIRDAYLEAASKPPVANEGGKVLGLLGPDLVLLRGEGYPWDVAPPIVEGQGRFARWFETCVNITPQRAVALLVAISRVAGDRRAWREALSAAGKEAARGRTTNHDQFDTGDYTTSSGVKVSAVEEYGYNAALAATSWQEFPVSRHEVTLDPAPSDTEWDALRDLIGCTQATRAHIEGVSQMRQRPFYVLPDGRMLLFDVSNALEQLWRAFDRAARGDANFYSGRYTKWIGDWPEERIGNALRRVFPHDRVYKKLLYPDPDKQEKGAEAEIDAAILYPPFLVLIEAKAKQFRLTDSPSDVGRLRTDLRENIAAGFDQAQRAMRFITHDVDPHGEARFVEKGTGRVMAVKREHLAHVYIVGVSQHFLRGLASRLPLLHSFNLFFKDSYPWALSLSNLETITRLCPYPDILLHYIGQRLAVQRSGIPFEADELELFGLYCQTRLHPSAYMRDDDGRRTKPQAVLLSGFQDAIDEYMTADHLVQDSTDLLQAPTIEPFHPLVPPGVRPPFKGRFFQAAGETTRVGRAAGLALSSVATGQSTGQIKKPTPKRVRPLLDRLRAQDDIDARAALPALLSLSDRSLRTISRMVEDARGTRTRRSPAGIRSANVEGMAVSVIVADGSQQELRLRASASAKDEKYRWRVQRSLCFAMSASADARAFAWAAWAEWTWRYDAATEEQLRVNSTPRRVWATRLPGRNDPCSCGSGRKFKKCCGG